MRRLALALALVSANASADGFFHELAREAAERLDAAQQARAPKLTPPTPIAVHWAAKKVGSLDLGAPLVALAAADLDGDGKGELYAVTPRDVIAIGVHHGVKELGRAAYTGELAVPAPRDLVGTAILDGDSIAATVSGWGRGIRVRWRGSTLVSELADPGFLVCDGERVQLHGGRNYFGDGSAAMYGARCRADVVDAGGHPQHVRAQLQLDNHLAVSVQRCDPKAACVEAGAYELHNVGTAFEIADVDRDGTVDVISASASAPGDGDAIKVVRLGDDDKKPTFRRDFNSGVAAIVAVDLDGNGALVVFAATRLIGSNRVDLWRLN